MDWIIFGCIFGGAKLGFIFVIEPCIYVRLAYMLGYYGSE